VRQSVEEIQQIIIAFYSFFNAPSLTGGPFLKSDGMGFRALQK
jgi:hypothetical protein